MTGSAMTLGGLRERLGFTGGAAALRVRFLGVIGFLIALIITFSLLSDRFLTFDNWRSILFTAAILTVVAAGQAIVVLTGNLDLSVGSIMGLTAYVIYDISGMNPAFGPWAVPAGILIGVALGAFNGFLVAVLDIPAIVATLGTLSIYRGFVSFYANAQEVTVGQLPGYMRDLATANWFGLPAYVWVALVIVLLLTLVMRRTAWGRMIYAYGSNPKAAYFFGLRSKRIIVGAYAMSGGVAAIAGLMLGAQVGNINSLLASGIEMQALAAVVIGGVSIWGGSGSIMGAAFGAVVLATINNGLVLMQVQEFYRLLIQGVAIILAVAVDAVVQRRVLSATNRRRIMEVEA